MINTCLWNCPRLSAQIFILKVESSQIPAEILRFFKVSPSRRKFKNADYISSSLSVGPDLCPKIELTFRRNAERYFSVYLLEPATAAAAAAAAAAAEKTFQNLILTILSRESVNSTWCLWCNASKFTYPSLFFFLLWSGAIWYSEKENAKRTTCRYKNNVSWAISYCGDAPRGELKLFVPLSKMSSTPNHEKIKAKGWS